MEACARLRHMGTGKPHSNARDGDAVGVGEDRGNGCDDGDDVVGVMAVMARWVVLVVMRRVALWVQAVRARQ